jgi:hypothetical protein
MPRDRISVLNWLRYVAAVCAFVFLTVTRAYSGDMSWALCIQNPSTVYFFVPREDTYPCPQQIAVVESAFLIGGVNKGLRARILPNGSFSEDGRRVVYLPRGTSVLVLKSEINGRKLVYIWDSHTFILMDKVSSQDGEPASYAWRLFDQQLEQGEFGITVRKTSFMVPSRPSSTDIPSGRIVEVHQYFQFPDGEKREVLYQNVIGYVDGDDLRLLHPPKMDPHKRYYAGSALTAQLIIKPCRVTETVSNLTRISRDIGLDGGLSLEKFAELTAKNRRETQTDDSRKQEISENVLIRTDILIIFADGNPASGFWQLIVGRPDPQVEELRYTITKISYCDGTQMQILITAGAKQLLLDGPVKIINEQDYEKYRIQFSNADFSDDNAFSLLAVLNNN